MYNIEQFCKNISNNIGDELDFNEEKKAVINYGLFAVVQIMISVILVLFFGVIFKVVEESMIILLVISILRQSSGGVHASSPSTCTLIGTILSVGMAWVINYINFNFTFIILVSIVIFIWAYYILYKLAPVDSPAKPIRTEAKRKRLKKSSILILSVYMLIVMGNSIGYYFTKNNNLLAYTGCIHVGVLWQVFSLTKTGHLVLGKLDALFK